MPAWLKFTPLPLLTGIIAIFSIWENPSGHLVTNLQSGWGDLLLHIRAATFFAAQSSWPSQSFLISGQPIGYPFLVDLISTWLIQAHVSITLAFLLPTVLLTIITASLLQFTAWRLTKSYPAAIISSLLFLGFGGLNAYVLLPTLLRSPEKFLTTLRDLPHTITAWHETNMVILNPFVMTLHQRGYLLGLPIFLLLLYFTWRHLRKPSHLSLISLTLAGLFLSFTHPFTWVSYLLILPVWTCLTWTIQHRRPLSNWLQFILATTIIALGGLIIVKYLQPNAGTSAITWHPGWLSPNLLTSPLFWLKNIGLYLPFGLIALVHLLRQKNSLAWLTLASLVPFIAGNLFQFAPWAWDNTKIFTPTWLILCLAIGAWLGSLWPISRWHKTGIIISLLTLTLSGTLEITRVLSYLPQPLTLATPQDQALGRSIQTITNQDDLILFEPIPNHPIFLFAGRPSLIAYEGWLWSQGWRGTYEQRLADLKTIYQGAANTTDLIKQNNISYLIIGPPELSQGANEPYFAHNYPLVLSQNNYRLYDVTRPRQ